MKICNYGILKGVIVGLHERALKESRDSSHDFLVAGKLFGEDMLSEETAREVRCRLATKVVDLYPPNDDVEGEVISEVSREYRIVKLMEMYLSVTTAPDPHTLDSRDVRKLLHDIHVDMTEDDKLVLRALCVVTTPLKKENG